jgi:hypothetical protein
MRPDVAVSGNAGLQVLPGNGDGTFGPALLTANVQTMAVATAGDFNRDGKNDLVVIAVNGAFVLLGDGGGRFSAPANLLVSNVGAISAVDLDRDGNLDLASTSPQINNGGTTSGAVQLLRGDGTGQFGMLATVVPLPIGAGRLVARDFNQDELPDLAVFIPGLGISLLPGSGSLLPHPPVQLSAGATSGGFAVGDFNRDGKLDLAVQADNFTPTSQTPILGNNVLLFCSTTPVWILSPYATR